MGGLIHTEEIMSGMIHTEKILGGMLHTEEIVSRIYMFMFSPQWISMILRFWLILLDMRQC